MEILVVPIVVQLFRFEPGHPLRKQPGERMRGGKVDRLDGLPVGPQQRLAQKNAGQGVLIQGLVRMIVGDDHRDHDLFGAGCPDERREASQQRGQP